MNQPVATPLAVPFPVKTVFCSVLSLMVNVGTAFTMLVRNEQNEIPTVKPSPLLRLSAGQHLP
jgi:hypothetical protein